MILQHLVHIGFAEAQLNVVAGHALDVRSITRGLKSLQGLFKIVKHLVNGRQLECLQLRQHSHDECRDVFAILRRFAMLRHEVHDYIVALDGRQ